MSLIPVVLWGTLVGLDGTSILQSMISRPLFAATVTGSLLGRPAEALAIGIILEIFSLLILPIGAAKYPESGVGAVVAAFAYSTGTTSTFDSRTLALALTLGLVWGWLAGLSARGVRVINAEIVAAIPRDGRVEARRLELLHGSAILIDGIRAGIMVLLGTTLGAGLLRLLQKYWWIPTKVTLGILMVSTTILLGATISLFGGWRSRALIVLLGAICGLITLYLL